MKVNIYYHTCFGRNDGPPVFYFYNLKKMKGVEVKHLVPDGDISKFGKADMHLWIDYGEDGLPVNRDWRIPDDGGVKVYVCSDAHWNDSGREYRIEKARQFDHVFVNQLEFVPWFKDAGIKNVHFLPHAAEPTVYSKKETIKKYDVCFIGHTQEQKNCCGFSRVEALDRAFKAFPNFFFGTRSPQRPEKNIFEDASLRFNESKICLNITAKGDTNMRHFEIAGSGSFQLTNWCPNLDQVFEDGKHLVTFKTLDEMVAKAEYYLKHRDEREAIAKAGHEHFLSNHTYKHRFETILKTLNLYPLK